MPCFEVQEQRKEATWQTFFRIVNLELYLQRLYEGSQLTRSTSMSAKGAYYLIDPDNNLGYT